MSPESIFYTYSASYMLSLMFAFYSAYIGLKELKTLHITDSLNVTQRAYLNAYIEEVKKEWEK